MVLWKLQEHSMFVCSRFRVWHIYVEFGGCFKVE